MGKKGFREWVFTKGFIRRALQMSLGWLLNYVMPITCISCRKLIADREIGLCAECWKKLQFISAPYCGICGKIFEFLAPAPQQKASLSPLCASCAQARPAYDAARAVVKFDQHSKKLIYAFKYHDKTIYAKFFASLLSSRYQAEFSDADIVAPVPMHWFKRLYRHYNPAELLAKELALILEKPMIPNLLIKKKWTKGQTRLTRKQRSKNLFGSIVVNKKYDLKNRKVLLIDDVLTTGATSNLCSKLLKKSGSDSVKIAAIAITLIGRS